MPHRWPRNRNTAASRPSYSRCRRGCRARASRLTIRWMQKVHQKSWCKLAHAIGAVHFQELLDQPPNSSTMGWEDDHRASRRQMREPRPLRINEFQRKPIALEIGDTKRLSPWRFKNLAVRSKPAGSSALGLLTTASTRPTSFAACHIEQLVIKVTLRDCDRYQSSWVTNPPAKTLHQETLVPCWRARGIFLGPRQSMRFSRGRLTSCLQRLVTRSDRSRSGYGVRSAAF